MLTLAGYLGSVDPWYDSNINGLGAMILKLAQMVIFLHFSQVAKLEIGITISGSSSSFIFHILIDSAMR